MTESLKMWRILSNKTNAFNKHVMQQKYLFDCTPRYVSSFKVHIFYALFFKRKGFIKQTMKRNETPKGL